jgi:hypothetical protein
LKFMGILSFNDDQLLRVEFFLEENVNVFLIYRVIGKCSMLDRKIFNILSIPQNY